MNASQTKESSPAIRLNIPMNRGDRRENIFEDEQDHVRFMETLGEACQKNGWQVHAGCLLGNHFHWVAKTPKGDKRKVMLAAELCG